MAIISDMVRKLCLLFCITLGVSAQGVYTRSADNANSGDYQESAITVASLKSRGISLKTVIPVIGDARGMEAQPLIVPGIDVSCVTSPALFAPKNTGGAACTSKRDIMVLPSMANVVRGVDAHTGAGIWQTPQLCRPVDGGPTIDMHRINDKWGVLSTPVAYGGKVYLVAWCSVDGSPQKGVHYIYTLNAATGVVVGSPVSLAGLQATSPSGCPGVACKTIGYSQTMRKQRSSLVLTVIAGRPMVFFAYGTVLETGRYASGAIVAYDTLLKKVTAFLPMSQGLGAGVWMGGAKLTADAQGNLYGVTGNGSFDGVADFGESIFKLSYAPALGGTTGGHGASLRVVSWWSPYSDTGRVGLDPTKSSPALVTRTNPAKLSGTSAPSEEAMPVGGAMSMPASTKTIISRDAITGQAVPLVYPTNPTDPAWSDEDLGSGGCTLVETYGKLLCGGKDGLGYVVNTDNMGNTKPADFADAKANCAKLAASPVWLTSSPGPVDPCPQDPTTLNFMPYGKTRHLHMTPVQYWSPKDGLHVFVWGENSALHDWRMAPSGALTYVAESRETASAGNTGSPGGMPGGFCALSSDHFKLGTAIIWCSTPYGDANAGITNGRLLAYDAEAISQDGDGPHLVKLWDSQDWGISYVFNKFLPPVIWDDEVILPNYNGGVMVFGQ